MNLFAWDMEPNIPNNGGEIFLNVIMCDSAFSLWEEKQIKKTPKFELKEQKPKVGDKGVQ
jgi:hypothetical protein